MVAFDNYTWLNFDSQAKQTLQDFGHPKHQNTAYQGLLLILSYFQPATLC